MKKLWLFSTITCLLLAWCWNISQTSSITDDNNRASLSNEEISYYEFAKKEACSNHRNDFFDILSNIYQTDDFKKYRDLKAPIIAEDMTMYYSPLKNTCIWEVTINEYGYYNHDVVGSQYLIVDLLTQEIIFNSSYSKNCKDDTIILHEYADENYCEKYDELIEKKNSITQKYK